MQKVVELKRLSFAYDSVRVLEDINLDVCQGDFLGVIGPNGGGKTTLMRLILGLLSPTSGVVKVFGKPPKDVRQMIGYVPQGMDVDRDFPISVIDVVLMGRLMIMSQLFWLKDILKHIDKQRGIRGSYGEYIMTISVSKRRALSLLLENEVPALRPITKTIIVKNNRLFLILTLFTHITSLYDLSFTLPYSFILRISLLKTRATHEYSAF
jgi:ABC-type branched-subunit amino acid transport system ATPase component